MHGFHGSGVGIELYPRCQRAGLSGLFPEQKTGTRSRIGQIRFCYNWKKIKSKKRMRKAQPTREGAVLFDARGYGSREGGRGTHGAEQERVWEPGRQA